MIPYVVRQGEHLAQIAYRLGFDANRVWSDPANDALREVRPDPDMLAPGDILHVPRAEPAAPLSLSTGARNRFRVRVPTVRVRVAIGRGGTLVRSEPFEARPSADREAPPIATGSTDGDGIAELEVPADLRHVRLTLPGRGLAFELRVGDLDPIDTPTGLRARLRQLGYFLGSGGPDEVARALAAFQADHGLDVTGALDAATRAAIRDAHGS